MSNYNFKLNELVINEKIPLFIKETQNTGLINHEGKDFELRTIKTRMFEKIYIDDLTVSMVQFFTNKEVVQRIVILYDEFDFNEVFSRVIHNYPNAQVLDNNKEKVILRHNDNIIEALKTYKNGFELYISSLKGFYKN